MIIADFQIEDKTNKPRFFQEIFLVANTKFKIILNMSCLKISNMVILFGEKTLIWKFYTISKALSTIKQVQIVDLKEFVIAALDVNNKTFVMHVTI